MGLLDMFKKSAETMLKKETENAINKAVKAAVSGKNRTEKFIFSVLPANVAELKNLPEASLDTPFKTTALVMAALCRYESSAEECIEMLDFLKGPESFGTMEQSFLRERLRGKEYKVRSYFEGSSPENNYTPTKPYTVAVSENPYSFPDENWATLYVTSTGADNPRTIKLRKKPSTGQWFLNEIQCLSDIRLPTAEDKWA